MGRTDEFCDFWPVGVTQGETLFRDPNFDARQATANFRSFFLRSQAARKFKSLRLLELLKNLEILVEARKIESEVRATGEETPPPAIASPPPPSTNTHRQIPHLALSPRLSPVPFAVPCR